MVNGDPAKSCCSANIFTPLVFDKPANDANDAAAVFGLDEAPPVKPEAPLLKLYLWNYTGIMREIVQILVYLNKH